MTSNRKFKNTPMYQGVDERVSYTVDTGLWPGTGDPTSMVVKLYDETGADVSATKLSGSASNAGAIISTPLVILLAAGASYRLEVQWVKSGNTYEAYGNLIGEL